MILVSKEKPATTKTPPAPLFISSSAVYFWRGKKKACFTLNTKFSSFCLCWFSPASHQNIVLKDLCNLQASYEILSSCGCRTVVCH